MIDQQDPLMAMADFMERTGGDWDFAKELIGVFLQESPHLLAATLGAAAGRDGGCLRSAAHALKGAIANFSTGDAFRAAAALEAMGKEGDFSNADSACLTLENELRRLSSQLRSLSKSGT